MSVCWKCESREVGCKSTCSLWKKEKEEERKRKYTVYQSLNAERYLRKVDASFAEWRIKHGTKY